MYLILTSKPGQFRTEPIDGLTPVEAYDYRFCGRTKAHFAIAELTGELARTRVRVVSETDEPSVNLVPAKFLERFDSLAEARRALEELCAFGAVDTELLRA